MKHRWGWFLLGAASASAAWACAGPARPYAVIGLAPRHAFEPRAWEDPPLVPIGEAEGVPSAVAPIEERHETWPRPSGPDAGDCP